MKVPAEFVELGSAFFAGSYVDGMSPEEWIISRVSFLDGRQRGVCLAFVDELLAEPGDGKRLQDAWRSSESNYCFDDAGVRVFLTMLREALAK